MGRPRGVSVLKGTNFAVIGVGQQYDSREVVMKRDTQQRPGVGKNAPNYSAGNSIGDPKPAGSGARSATVGSVTPTVTISARYIDSRLKQFCCR